MQSQENLTTNTSEIYLDNAATTFLDPAAAAAMAGFTATKSGNPTSLHRAGVRAATQIEAARALIAQQLHSSADELYFTSGGTEANEADAINKRPRPARRRHHPPPAGSKFL